MKLIIQIIIICKILTQYQADCGTAHCAYKFAVSKDYICTITLFPSDDEINNKTILESYDVIAGDHKGGSDDLVTGLGGSGTDARIFPGTICKKFKNLKKIILAYSDIQKLTEKSFRDCANLDTLSFVDTAIKWIGQDTFKNIAKLEKLTIGSSQLSYISEILLKNNQNLKELRLSSNQLSLFNEKVLENQQNLKTLVLSYNKIAGFPKFFFKSLKNLETLDVQNNLIANISAVWFVTLINLKELDLSNNLIEDLPKSVLLKQEKLEKLNLDSNLIQFIHYDSFLVLPNIIRLSKNQIEGIDENFIRKLIVTEKSVLLIGNKCTEDSQITEEDGQDEVINPIDEDFLMEIESCFYSYIPRSENYQKDQYISDIYEKLNYLTQKIERFSDFFRL
ncbi:unnamed protein product [Chironomus riparius]|uniref:Uncharacterized protein n=1 Tax=Chironomus riparius TaxID=315576 RepID=A0A9N9WT69_9DIPT|nr:unnamed protein product [Chironomus riparius]